MFGLGTWEILMILIAALVFIGPSKLPSLARTMGKGMRDVRRAMAGFEDEVRKATDIPDSPAPPAQEPQGQTVHRDTGTATPPESRAEEQAEETVHASAASDDAASEVDSDGQPEMAS